MQVMDVDSVLHGNGACFIGGAVAKTAFHAAARQPHGEPEMIVISAALGLPESRAPEFTTPDYERIGKQPAKTSV